MVWSLACLLLMLVPWACGLQPGPAAAVLAMIVAGWWSGMKSLPGRGGAVSDLRIQGRRVQLGSCRGGLEAELLPSSRVGPGWVLLRVRCGRQPMSWWLTSAALDETSFRRLRVHVRCSATR